MYDINFFSIYKKKKSKSKGLRVFIIVFVVLLLIFNVVVIGGGLFYINTLEKSIAEKQAYINAEDTKEKIAQANLLRKEANLTRDYLAALNLAVDGFDKIDIIDTNLLNEIRKMTPVTTLINSSMIVDNVVTLNCTSNNTHDPIDMYHALLNNPNFANVTFSGFLADPETRVSAFMIAFQVTGGIEQ